MIFLIKINVTETENPEKSGLQEFMEQSIREEKAACEAVTALQERAIQSPGSAGFCFSLQLSTESTST